MTTDRFAVTLAVDQNIFAPAVFTAHSVLSRAPKHPFDLVIAVPRNTIARSWIDYAENKVGAKVVEFAFERALSYGRAINRYPPSAFYRYSFNQFLGSAYRKVIFLDADIRVTGDISTLFGLDLGGQPFAAVPDVVIHSDVVGQWQPYLANLGLDPGISYANTGVLVIDPASWARNNVSERVLGYISEHADKCFLADQSALNALVRGDFVRLSPVWNMLSGLWFRSKAADLVSPAVFHYSGAFKPWRRLTWPYDRAVSRLYSEFFRDSPWPDAVNWSGSRGEWETFLKSRYRAALRRLRGKDPAMSISSQTMLAFRQYVQATPFADIQQGLAVRQPDGPLRAA